MKKLQSTAGNPPMENEPIQPSVKIEEASGIPDQSVPESAAEEDLLVETRRALIEEQAAAASKPGVLQKVKNRLKSPRGQKKEKAISDVAAPKAETTSSQDEIGGISRTLEIKGQETVKSAEETALDAEIQSILNVLDKAESGATDKPPEAEKAPVSEQKPIENVLETAHQVLASKPQKDESPDYQELRDIALEDYQEPAPETAVAPPRPSINKKVEGLAKRINYRALIRITTRSMAILIILAVFMVGAYMIKTQPLVFTHSTTTPTELVPTASPPIPVQIRLPGGWAFVLTKGSVVNGKWMPNGPEWLEGTEICKWVSLPSSEQLEAVFKTLKPGDRIELVMTNYDHWLYRVRSIDEVTANQMTSLDKNYPSLLLILTRKDSDTRLVILAVP